MAIAQRCAHRARRRAAARDRRGARGGARGRLDGGDAHNRAYGAAELGDVAPELVELAYDPQTAGGLLVSLPRDKAPALEAEFAAAGLFLARVGAFEAGAASRSPRL